MPGNGLWRTKSIEQSIADTDEPETRLRKDLTAWDLAVFGVAVVIGAGIFTLTARTAGDLAGPSVSLSFVLAAIACALAAAVGVGTRTRPDLRRGFRMPGVRLLPILSIGASLWLMLNLTVVTWLRFLAWMVLGVIIYFAYSRRNSLLGLQRITKK